jgi:hypothetical protein
MLFIGGLTIQSHGHRRLALDGNLNSQISPLNLKLNGQWPLAPALG